MRARISLPAALGSIGLPLVGLGLVFLTVACENLPGFLGGTPGDTSPRTPLGSGVLALGLLALGLASMVASRRRLD